MTGLDWDKLLHDNLSHVKRRCANGLWRGMGGTGQVRATGSRWGLKRDAGSAAQPKADGMAEPELLRMGRDKLLSPSDGTRSADGMGRDWNIGTDMNGMYPLRGLSRLVGACGTLIGVPGIPGLRCAPTRAIQSHPYRAEIEGLGTRLETSDGTL